MDIVIIVAMLTPIAIFIILAPVFYVIKLRRDYNAKKNLEFVSLSDAISGSIPLISEEGTRGSSFVIYTLKDSEHFIQYGYEDSGFVLYLFKSSLVDKIHLNKFKSLIITHNYKQVENTPIEKLNPKEFLELNSGFNVNVGEDPKEIEQITKEIFEKVFDAKELTVNAQYEL